MQWPLTIARFRDMTRLQVRLYAASNPASEAVCLLTCSPISALSHVVHASDGRDYDALSLHKWAATSEADPFHVLPGCAIVWVTSRTRTSNALDSAFRLYALVRAYARFETRSASRCAEEGTMVASREAPRSVGRSRSSPKPTIPGESSAFFPYRRGRSGTL